MQQHAVDAVGAAVGAESGWRCTSAQTSSTLAKRAPGSSGGGAGSARSQRPGSASAARSGVEPHAAMPDDRVHRDAEALGQAREVDVAAARAQLVDHRDHQRARPLRVRRQHLERERETALQRGRVEHHEQGVGRGSPGRPSSTRSTTASSSVSARRL